MAAIPFGKLMKKRGAQAPPMQPPEGGPTDTDVGVPPPPMGGGSPMSALLAGAAPAVRGAGPRRPTKPKKGRGRGRGY